MDYIIIIACSVIIISIMLKVYMTLTAGVYHSMKTLEGKTVIITGANSGIGLETAKDMAKRNAKVILACRNLDKGREALEDIISTTSNPNISLRYLDLSSLSSVRKFAKNIIDNEERLDILINNAATVPSPGKYMTEDNFELQFATNYFGPFVLTNLLLPLLIKSAPSRIIIVASLAYVFGKLDLQNLNCEKHETHPYLIYANTKLANILFMRELSKKLSGSKVTVNALHPGVVKTSLGRNKNWLSTLFTVPFMYIFGKSSKIGAQTSIYLATSDDVGDISGGYFENCRQARLLPRGRNDKLARKLWEHTEKITKLSN